MSPSSHPSDEQLDAARQCRHLVPDGSVYAVLADHRRALFLPEGRRRRVLDSTILEDAVATQDTVTRLVAAIRRVRRLVLQARGVELVAHDDERPGKPDCAWDDSQATRALVSGLVGDVLATLAAVADLELGDEQADAVALLALVAGQDVEPGDRPGSCRIARRVAQERVISTVDPQARHTRKTSAKRRDGYKGHIATEPETGLVTKCALTRRHRGGRPARGPVAGRRGAGA